MRIRGITLAAVAALLPACGGNYNLPAHLGWNGPDSLQDQTYSNGHPLVVSSAQTTGTADFETQNYQALNTYRAGLGLPPLARDLAAEGLGRAYSAHMPIEPFFAHLDPEGDTLLERAVRVSGQVPYGGLRENLMWTTDPSPSNVIAAFVGSPGHKANLEGTDVNVVGIGIWYDGAGKYYLTQEYFYR